MNIDHDYLQSIFTEVRKRYPHLLKVAGQPRSTEPLYDAYAKARELGIQDSETMDSFLCLSVLSPRFFESKRFVDWMAKDHRSLEQRFRDFYGMVVFFMQLDALERGISLPPRPPPPKPPPAPEIDLSALNVELPLESSKPEASRSKERTPKK